MRFIFYLCAATAIFAVAAPAAGQVIHCVDPPSATPAEAACRIPVDTLPREVRLTLQLRDVDDDPMPYRTVDFVATSGVIRNDALTDARGFVTVTWRGAVPQEGVTITASAALGRETTRRQIRLTRKEPANSDSPYIRNVSPTGDHSAFASRYLSDDIEVEVQAGPATCNRTKVVFEYLSAGSGDKPGPIQATAPALWSELDPGRFGCAAQMRWILSSAVGNQELRTWIQRDSSFVVPIDEAGAQRYLRPYVVHAVAHAPPAFLAGAAVIDSANGGGVPKLVGLDLSFPTLADLLKHGGLQGPGAFVDRTRIFVATEFNGQLGKNVYLGMEPLVMLIGPRAADLPVAVAAGRRLGAGRNRWFLAGLVNAGSIAGLVASGFGIK